MKSDVETIPRAGPPEEGIPSSAAADAAPLDTGGATIADGEARSKEQVAFSSKPRLQRTPPTTSRVSSPKNEEIIDELNKSVQELKELCAEDTENRTETSHYTILEKLFIDAEPETATDEGRKKLPYESSPITETPKGEAKEGGRRKVFESSVDSIAPKNTNITLISPGIEQSQSGNEVISINSTIEQTNKNKPEAKRWREESSQEINEKKKYKLDDSIQQIGDLLTYLDKIIEEKFTNTAIPIKQTVTQLHKAHFAMKRRKKHLITEMNKRIDGIEKLALSVDESRREHERLQEEEMEEYKNKVRQEKEEEMEAFRQQIKIQQEKTIDELQKQVDTLTKKVAEQDKYSTKAEKRDKEEQWLEHFRQSLETDDQEFEKIWQLTEETWPNKAYQPINTRQGNPCTQKQETIVIIHGETDKDIPATKYIKDNYTGGKKLLGRNATQINTANLTIASNLNIEGEEENNTTVTIHSIKLPTQNMTMEDWDKVYKCMKQIINKLKTMDKKEIAVNTSNPDKEDRIKKLLRTIIHGTDITTNFYTIQGKTRRNSRVTFEKDKNNEEKEEEEETQTRNDRMSRLRGKRQATKNKTNAVIINNTEKRSYAETLSNLRQMKKELDEKKIDIGTIKQSKQGDTVIVLKEGCDKTKELQELMEQKIGGKIYQRPRNDQVVLILSGMDFITNKEDINEAIQHAVKMEEADKLEIEEPRTAYANTKRTIVRATKRLARELLNKKTIRIGIIDCHIRERVNILRCYKCRAMGHAEADCQGPDRRNSCGRCGDEVHIGKRCSKEATCFNCETNNNHKTGTMSCPVHRALVRSRQNKREGNRRPSQEIDYIKND